MHGPVASSAHHLLNVIDFVCLGAGAYLLLVFFEKGRRLGHLLIAMGLAVLALRLVTEQMFMGQQELRFAALTLSLAVAAFIISWGTVALVDRGRPVAGAEAVPKSLVVVAGTIAILGTVTVWALPFWDPLRELARSASSDSAFLTFEKGLQVAAAVALLACAWITWERQTAGPALSRMLGAAYSCWAVAAILGLTPLLSHEGGPWLQRGIQVLGSLFLGNAVTVYAYRSERVAAQRQKRLALIDQVVSAAIAAPRLEPMIVAATDAVRRLLEAHAVVAYLVNGERTGLAKACEAGAETVLPEHLGMADDHPIIHALISQEPVTLDIDAGDRSHASGAYPGVAAPLSSLDAPVGVLVVVMPREEQVREEDTETLGRAAAHLGIMVQQMMLLEGVREARDRWQQTFDSIAELVTVHDVDGRIVAANMAVQEFAGLSEEQMVGEQLCDLFGPEYADQQEMLTKCIRTGASPGTSVRQTRGRTHQVQVSLLRDDTGAVYGCVRVARDITSRWRAEERLAQSERRYRELAENAHDIIFTHDLEGNFLYVNRAAVQVLGYSKEQFSRLRIWDIIAPESIAGARSYVENLIDGRAQDDHVELRMMCADGRVAIVQLRGNLLRRGGEHQVIHGTARDVTAETQLTAQLMQADRLASVGTLIAGIAHDLNNPLTTISGYADLLKMDLQQTEHGEFAARITEEAERCRDVARNLLNFARQTDEPMLTFDLNALIRGVCDLRAYDLRAAHIQVEQDLQPLPQIVADYGQIQQVVYNLVDNAYYAMQQQGGGVLTVATEADGDQVRLRVSDTGPGLAEDVRDRIFEPFFTTKPRGEGTGLGLSICRRILTDHGGEIEATSGPEGGCSFTVSLPVGEATPGHEREEPPAAASTPQRARVLFIDDERALGSLVREYLGRQGHEVAVTESAEAGLEMALADSYDVIICDMRLPGMSGEDFCVKLLEQRPTAADRILVATGDLLSPQTQAFFDRTGLPHIHKPFQLQDLERIIADVMAGRRVRSGS